MVDHVGIYESKGAEGRRSTPVLLEKIRSVELHSHLTGVALAKLQQHLSNMNMMLIGNQGLTLIILKIGERMGWRKSA